MTVMKASDLLRASGNHAGLPAANSVPTGALYSCTTHNLIYRSDGTSWATWATLGSSGVLLAANNLSDVANAGTARTNLGLGTAATKDTGSTSGKVPLIGVGDIIPASLLGTGATSSNFLRGDGTYATPAGGGGGGGGFGGQYAAGSHAPGELLAYGPYLWTPRTTTSTAPGVDAGPISGYTVNGPTGAISGDVATLIDHATSGSGSIWAPSAISGWQSLSLAATVYAGDRADGFWFGYCDPAASITNSNSNAPGVASFTGVGWDVYNGGLAYYINGTLMANYGARWGTLERWQDLSLDFSVAGGNLTMRLNGGVKVTTTAPSWTTARVYAHGQSGGANGTFMVRGRPIAFNPASTDWRRVSVLVDQS